MTEFAVWAPLPERVRLDVDGSLYPMNRSEAVSYTHLTLPTIYSV